MSEAVASQMQFRAPSLAAPGVCNETLRQQVEDFELLIETLLDRYEQQEGELRDVKDERDRLKDELERRKRGE